MWWNSIWNSSAIIYYKKVCFGNMSNGKHLNVIMLTENTYYAYQDVAIDNFR